MLKVPQYVGQFIAYALFALVVGYFATQPAYTHLAPDEALINPLLESELERRFIESLRQADGFQVNPEVVNGRPGLLLRIGPAAWKIIPQVELGPEQGIPLSSRPDFVLKPLRPSKGMSIAVFLDGFAAEGHQLAGHAFRLGQQALVVDEAGPLPHQVDVARVSLVLWVNERITVDLAARGQQEPGAGLGCEVQHVECADAPGPQDLERAVVE